MNRYERYEQFCRVVGVHPMDFERWTKFTDSTFVPWNVDADLPKSWRGCQTPPKRHRMTNE